MHRLSNGTQTNTAPTPPAVDGKPGYPTQGDPATASIPSEIDYYQAFTLQEELCAVVEAAGLVEDKANNAQVLAALRALIGTGTQFIAKLEYSAGAIPANTFIPAGGRKVLLEMCAGGGAGGSGGGPGGGGGASGAAGVRGWLNVASGAAITGSAGVGGTTNASGTAGVTATQSTLTIGGTLIATCGPGNNGALGGSPVVAGDTNFGQVSYADPGLSQYSGESGGNGMLIADLMIGGEGGSSMFGGGGKSVFTPNTTGAAASGHSSSFFGGGGSGATGTGTGAAGEPGVIRMWVFG